MVTDEHILHKQLAHRGDAAALRAHQKLYNVRQAQWRPLAAVGAQGTAACCTWRTQAYACRSYHAQHALVVQHMAYSGAAAALGGTSSTIRNAETIPRASLSTTECLVPATPRSGEFGSEDARTNTRMRTSAHAHAREHTHAHASMLGWQERMHATGRCVTAIGSNTIGHACMPPTREASVVASTA